MANQDKIIRHIALCKIKDDTDQTTIKEIVTRFFDMKNKIEGIQDMEHSVNIGDLELANGYNHIFMVMFNTEEARDFYLPHEAHVAFGNFLGQYVEKVVGVDFWTNRDSGGDTHGY